MKFFIAVLFTTAMVHAQVSAHEPTGNDEVSAIISACESDCRDAMKSATAPEAKAKAAHECAEKKGRLNKSFRKSKCWEVNEQYEKTVAAEKK